MQKIATGRKGMPKIEVEVMSSKFWQFFVAENGSSSESGEGSWNVNSEVWRTAKLSLE